MTRGKKDIDGENFTHMGILAHCHDDEASHEMIGNSYHSMHQIKIRDPKTVLL
jgi:hypothetical protein